MALRDESAHRRGREYGAGAHGDRDASQRAGRRLALNLLLRKETSAYGDAGYIGADKRVSERRGRDWFIATKRGKIKATEDDELRDLLEQIEHEKALVCAKVEHPLRIVKREFGYLKVRYRGLAKDGVQVMTLFALANL